MHHSHIHREKGEVYRVCANCGNHTLQTYQHPVLALLPDGSGLLTFTQDLAGHGPNA